MKRNFCRIILLILTVFLLILPSIIIAFAEEEPTESNTASDSSEVTLPQTETSSESTSEQVNTPSESESSSETSSVISTPAQSQNPSSVIPNSSDAPPKKPEYDYGDDRGLIVGDGKYLTVPATDGIMNGSFEQGFKYWTTVAGNKPENVVTQVKENENSYIQINGGTVKDVIVTPKFNAGNVMAGQRLVLIYDWRGSKDFILNLNQVTGSTVTTLETGNGGIVSGDGSGNDWSTCITKNIFDVIGNYTDDGKLQFTVEVGPSGNKEAVTFIDNIRVGIYNRNNGHIYDTYGNLIYDTKTKDLNPVDPAENSKKQVKEELSKSKADVVTEKAGDSSVTVIIWIMLAALGLGVLLFFGYELLRKKNLIFFKKSDRDKDLLSGFSFEENTDESNEPTE